MRSAVTGALPLLRWRVLDFVQLTKPRIAVMVLFTVAIGALLAGRGRVDMVLILNVLAGTGLVAGAAGAFNHLMERHVDAQMRRTENRPLPAGRLQPSEVLIFGLTLATTGLSWLALTARYPLAAFVAALTLIAYIGLYTPLKRYTTWNTLVGAIPGALPPVIGWTAVTGTVDRDLCVIFLVMFLWQVPHFLAIAWIHRDDYARAGLQMLSVADPTGARTGRHMVSYCLGLISVSLLPVLWHGAGSWYAVGAVLLGGGFALTAIGFARRAGHTEARRVLYASLLYLPLLLALLLMDAWLGYAL
ncbi:MAG: heme o synthase [Nitrospira sp.]|nr:heme o synthase [Nitrospira sp.]